MSSRKIIAVQRPKTLEEVSEELEEVVGELEEIKRKGTRCLIFGIKCVYTLFVIKWTIGVWYL